MRKTICLLGLLAAAFQQTSASAAPETQTTQFPLKDFDRVYLLGADDVTVVPGRSFAVTAAGPSDALRQLDIRVEDGALKVRRHSDKGFRLSWGRQTGSAHVTVTMPLIRSASLAGAGDLIIDAPTSADRFDASLSGSGNLRLAQMQARAVDLSLSGSGDLKLRGAADRLSVRLSGSGSVDASGLPVRSADVSLSGVGDIAVRASERATGRLSGVGDIRVTGGAVCEIRRSGMGDVKC